MDRRLALVFALLMLCNPFANADEVWRETITKQYPRTSYRVAFGIASTTQGKAEGLAKAVLVARAEMLKSLSVKVSASSAGKRDYQKVTSGASQTNESYHQEYQEYSEAISLVDLDTSQYSVDDASNSVEVAAILDISKTVARLTTSMRITNSEIANYTIEKCKSARALAHLRVLSQKIQDAEQDLVLLRIFDPEHAGLGELPTQRIKDQLQKCRDEIRFTLVVPQDYLESVQSVLKTEGFSFSTEKRGLASVERTLKITESVTVDKNLGEQANLRGKLTLHFQSAVAPGSTQLTSRELRSLESTEDRARLKLTIRLKQEVTRLTHKFLIENF